MQENRDFDSENFGIAINLLESGKWNELQQHLAKNHEDPKFDETYSETLWLGALRLRSIDGGLGFNTQPNYRMITVLALYSINPGHAEQAILKAFQPGFFGINHPKDALIAHLAESRNDPGIARIRKGLEEGGLLLKILRYESNPEFVKNDQWENQARNTLDPSAMHHHTNKTVLKTLK